MLHKLFFAFAFLPVFVFATELRPWTDRDLEIQSRTTYLLQSFSDVSAPHGPTHYGSNDSFLTFSLPLSFVQYSIELEATAAATRRHSFNMDNVKLTGRYQWLNDVIGDPVSLITGLSISEVFRRGRHDIGIFHHGSFETEAHISIGKEVTCYQFWTSRWWSILGLGMGDVGFPWIRLDGGWEQNWWDLNKMQIFGHSLWGLGNRNLSLVRHFPGYGKIQHQSIEIGTRYSRLFECGLTVSLEYAYRIYSKNCPRNVNLFLVQLHYPFGIPYVFGYNPLKSIDP